MAKVSKIIEKMEVFAPPELAAEWDNSGWQIYLGQTEIKKILLVLSPTLDAINQAIKKNCSLIIAHHPLFFQKINSINTENHFNLIVAKAIQSNIQIYSSHTNLDSTQNGIADRLANLLELKNIESIENFVRIGELEKEENLDEFLEKLKKTLNIEKIKLINPSNKRQIRRIAVCPGSGGDFVNKLNNVDLFITGDIKYHTALEVNNSVVVDAGHLETERIILPVLKDLLQEPDLDIFIAEESSPWQIM